MKFDKHTNINDTYEVKRRLAAVIEELQELYDTDITKFYSPRKIKAAGTRSRTRIRKISKDLKGISKDILKQRQDYESDYE